MEGLTPYDLSGRLEAVCIDHSTNRHQNDAIGHLKNLNIYVVNGANYIGRECLVRFRLTSQERNVKMARGAVISASVPDGFIGMYSFEYVLLAQWEDYMINDQECPTMSQVLQYYDPGDLPFAFYLKKNSTEYLGRFYVGRREYSENYGPISDIIQRLPSSENSKLIITEPDESQIGQIVHEICRASLFPVVMEPSK